MTQPIDEHASPPHSRPLAVMVCIAGSVIVAALLGCDLLGFLGEAHPHVSGEAPPLWGVGIIPFAGILLSIALLPLIPATHHWWESNLSRYFVSIIIALITLGFVFLTQGAAAIGTVLHHSIIDEYIPFIVLLFCLYVISGGICLRGNLPAHPLTNTIILAIGAGIASFIGTTGASMLLIRPLLSTNATRKHKVHTVVMFIFLVSNIGGTLLPIGDPPLFLGYLKGVPFEWTLGLWREWLFVCLVLLGVYYAWDSILYRKESPAAISVDEHIVEPIRISGSLNLVWLIGVIVCVAFVDPSKTLPGTDVYPFLFLRELLMLAFVGLSLLLTSRATREANHFNYAAILEVAAIFIGIFIAMQVPLEVVRAYGGEITAHLNQPWAYYWITGSLSSVLDNAPTYVVFLDLVTQDTVEPGMIAIKNGGVPVDLLVPISLGAVFMGSMTYIGNGPNFMVKAIADQAGVKMPSFFGYLFKYSLPVLIPVFILVTVIFLL
jgi:Na+/H+ antiporter NhaD/arsenite permease-like protein